MKDVINFLLANGFKQEKHNICSNEHVEVVIHEDHYEVMKNQNGDTMYSDTLNIYWLIGLLTYYGWMDRDYIVLEEQKNKAYEQSA